MKSGKAAGSGTSLIGFKAIDVSILKFDATVEIIPQ